MEISQEVSDVKPNPDDALTPTIQQRKINSTVAIQSGETVVLGGLIKENDSFTSSGIPGLHKIPILGFLFGSTNDDRSRTELVVLITPRAVQGATDARRITDEFRDKMESLKPETEENKNDEKSEPSASTTQ
jgi:general secretion pathway protein D